MLSGVLLLAGCEDNGDDQGQDRGEPDAGDDVCADGFDLPGDAFFPEGVAALEDGTVFVGSSTSGVIVRSADPCEGGVTTFAPSPEPLMSAVGLRADEARGLLWACRALFDASLPARLDAHDLDTGEVVASHEFPGASCNDIALDAAGNLYATDPVAHEIVFVAASDALSDADAEVWLADPLFELPPGQFSVNGLAFDPDGTLHVGNYHGNALYRIPVLAGGAPGPVEVVPVGGDPLAGPDGLQWHDGGLLIVENTAGRLSRFTFDDAGTASRTVLADGLDFPATVGVTATGAWVCEAQTDHLLGLDPSPPTTPFRVVRVPL